MASRIRWNQVTQIWELAVDPTIPNTLFNHLPIANPTLPLDTANKAYVDSAVAGVSGFVPYVGATANVQLGNFSLYATQVRAFSFVNSVDPTLGVFTGANLAALALGGAYGLLHGQSGAGDAWMQVQRVDGGGAVYNLRLQPRGGKVGIGYLDSTSVYIPALLNINSGGDPFTNVGWNRAIEVANSSSIKWKGGTYFWGMGQSGDHFYLFNSTANDNSAAIGYRLFIAPGGQVTIPGDLVNSSPASSLMIGNAVGTVITGYLGMQISFSDVCQLAVRAQAYATEGGLFAHNGSVYMGAWTTHPLVLRANNTNRAIFYPSYNIELLGYVAINAAANGTSPLKILGLPTAHTGHQGDIYIDVPAGNVLKWSN